MVIALGGWPLSFKQVVHRDLDQWEYGSVLNVCNRIQPCSMLAQYRCYRASGMQPFFVFTGIPQHRKEPPFSAEDRRPGIRQQG
jgi:hypothetical protein